MDLNDARESLILALIAQGMHRTDASAFLEQFEALAVTDAAKKQKTK